MECLSGEFLSGIFNANDKMRLTILQMQIYNNDRTRMTEI